MPQERLQKIIAAAGITSRRKAENLITTGQVSVNGSIVTELGAKADPEHDHIKVAGKLLARPQGRFSYILLNKPRGYVTTLSDPQKRKTVLDLLHGIHERLYPVGRLDFNSEGLLLLTNDGDLANKLTQASSLVPKTYVVKVSGKPNEAAIEKLRRGISIAGGKIGSTRVRTAPAQIRLIKEGENPWYEVTLIEGRNRQIRKMFEEIGHHVEKIRRVRYGPLELDIEPGKFRSLQPGEIARLKRAVEERRSRSPEPGGKSGRAGRHKRAV